ncbi:MAG: ABC-2 family transporter protein [Phycisphaerae bacterium]|nr:ABC-2 family transporter protein [Phycisphaerae bacterium]
MGDVIVVRAFRLMLLFVRVSVQNVAAYRFDLIARTIVSLMHVGAELLGVWIIFTNTQVLAGWRWQHMLVLVGVYRIISGGIHMSIMPNMRKVLEDIREGTLDFVLMRPVHSQLLVSIREFVIWRVADVVLGVCLAVYGCVKLVGHVPLGAAVTFVLMLTAGFAIVYSVWLMLATLCFWFVRIQNIEMIFWNVFEAGRFPIVIYRPSVRWLLTFVVPLAFITTFPAVSFIGDPSLLGEGGAVSAAPVWAFGIAAVMLLISGWFWLFGLRHYSGASA